MRANTWQNDYAESFNSRLRDELLDPEIFGSLLEAKVVLEKYLRHYTEERLHSALGYLTPKEYALRVEHFGSAPTSHNPPERS